MRTKASVAALLLTLAACTGSAPKATIGQAGGGMAPTPTATPSSPKIVAPLTGLDVSIEQTRAALAVKIENEKPARPQSGLQYADIVYEEQIEGGDTRFLAIFQSTDAPFLGPVRSARMVDPDILLEYNPVFAYSGGAKVVLAHVRESGLPTMTESTPGAFHREHHRHAPHNLYSSTADLYAAAPTPLPAPPKSFFTYDEQSAPAPVDVPEPDVPRGHFLPAATPNRLSVKYSGAQVSVFEYDAATNTYKRSQGSRRKAKPHVMEDDTQIEARNVLVMFIKTKLGHHLDAAGNKTPDGIVIGSGNAYLLRDGRLVKGRWARASVADPTLFTDDRGETLKLAPGKTWIELAPPSSVVSIT